MSKHNEHSLKDAIAHLLKTYKLDDKMAEKRLIDSWENVMGAMIAKHTLEIYIQHQQLVVKLDSAALRNELVLAKSKIVTLLNEAAGRKVINEVILR